MWPLHDPETLLGRSRTCHIIVGSPLASRVHARLLAQNGGLLMVDTGSRNGTTVNGERVQGSISLKKGDRIGIGSDVLELVEVEAETLTAVTTQPIGNEEVTRSVRALNILDIVPFLIDECAREGRAEAVLPQLREVFARFTESKTDALADDVAKLRGLLRAARVRIEHPEFQTWVESALAKLA